MLFFLLAACNLETDATPWRTCEVELIALEPATAAPESEVVLTARPLTEDWDTALRVGGLPAQVLEVSRTDCADCDTCRVQNSCASCGEDCDPCDTLCDSECIETLTFAVPDLADGIATVEMINAHGASTTLISRGRR